MDGNRRWARERGLPTVKGHQAGYKTFKQVAQWCKEAGVTHLAVYAFSTENWKRNEEEVGYLMDLMRELLEKGLPDMHKEDVAVHIVGDLSLFPEDIQSSIQRLHSKNPASPTQHLWVCASYGGKSEVVAAANRLLQGGVKEVTEEEFTRALWTADMPAADIIIRTGGEKRLSNFLMWHSGYSELFFIDTYWPDFSQAELQRVLDEFATRKRNYGK
jgi:undecaprenyl diphosphate synthase